MLGSVGWSVAEFHRASLLPWNNGCANFFFLVVVVVVVMVVVVVVVVCVCVCVCVCLCVCVCVFVCGCGCVRGGCRRWQGAVDGVHWLDDPMVGMGESR